MNYLCGLLGIALLGALLSAAIYRGDAASWELKYDKLGAAWAAAEITAKQHAQAMEAKQAADLKKQSDNALSQASNATSKANAVRAVYEGKLAELKKQPKLDLPHECANQLIPAELIP